MNCTVRFGKQFSESSPCLPGQQGTGQQGWYASGTLRKQFTKPTVQFILGRSTAHPNCSASNIPSEKQPNFSVREPAAIIWPLIFLCHILGALADIMRVPVSHFPIFCGITLMAIYLSRELIPWANTKWSHRTADSYSPSAFYTAARRRARLEYTESPAYYVLLLRLLCCNLTCGQFCI